MRGRDGNTPAGESKTGSMTPRLSWVRTSAVRIHPNAWWLARNSGGSPPSWEGLHRMSDDPRPIPAVSPAIRKTSPPTRETSTRDWDASPAARDGSNPDWDGSNPDWDESFPDWDGLPGVRCVPTGIRREPTGVRSERDGVAPRPPEDRNAPAEFPVGRRELPAASAGPRVTRSTSRSGVAQLSPGAGELGASRPAFRAGCPKCRRGQMEPAEGRPEFGLPRPKSAGRHQNWARPNPIGV